MRCVSMDLLVDSSFACCIFTRSAACDNWKALSCSAMRCAVSVEDPIKLLIDGSRSGSHSSLSKSVERSNSHIYIYCVITQKFDL